MSDLNNTDARKHRADGSLFAPRRHRVPPDEAAVMPMLERLSRGESDHASRARKPESVPPAEPIRAPRHAPLAGSRLPLSATGRIAVVLGLVMTVTAVSAALLKSNAQHPATTDTAKALKASSDKQAEAKIQAKNQVKDQAKVQSTDMPRTVHTVAIRPQAATAAPIVGTKPASPAETAQTLPDALRTWVMYPDPQVAQAPAFTTGEGSKTESAKTSEPTKISEPVKEAAKKPAHAHHKAKAKRTARRHRRRHRVRHRSVRTAAKPQPVQQAQAAPPTAAEPTKKMPIQAAIDAMFGGSDSASSSGGASGGGSAPMTTGTAFQ